MKNTVKHHFLRKNPWLPCSSFRHERKDMIPIGDHTLQFSQIRKKRGQEGQLSRSRICSHLKTSYRFIGAENLLGLLSIPLWIINEQALQSSPSKKVQQSRHS